MKMRQSIVIEEAKGTLDVVAIPGHVWHKLPEIKRMSLSGKIDKEEEIRQYSVLVKLLKGYVKYLKEVK